MSETPASPTAAVPEPASAVATQGRWIAVGAVVLGVLGTAALVMAWSTQQRVKVLEGELVKRQTDSGAQAAEARLLARQAQESTRDASAKLALLEARVAESTFQRSQLEDLIQALARSRDENVLADIDAALRVAVQHSAITGSVDPLVAALRQADERLGRHAQPRLERVRRAVAQDLDRARTAGAVDVPMLSLRLDEIIRQVDELPLLSALDRKGAARAQPRPAAAAASAASAPTGWAGGLGAGWSTFVERAWNEVRTLVRVTRIEVPEAMLVAPEQLFFLRENLKLRLLNARLALLSRQFDIAQSDLRDAQSALERYFDRSSRRVASAMDTVRQVTAQARVVTVPRPDATLAAIAAAGR